MKKIVTGATFALLLLGGTGSMQAGALGKTTAALSALTPGLKLTTDTLALINDLQKNAKSLKDSFNQLKAAPGKEKTQFVLLVLDQISKLVDYYDDIFADATNLIIALYPTISKADKAAQARKIEQIKKVNEDMKAITEQIKTLPATLQLLFATLKEEPVGTGLSIEGEEVPVGFDIDEVTEETLED